MKLNQVVSKFFKFSPTLFYIRIYLFYLSDKYYLHEYHATNCKINIFIQSFYISKILIN